MGKRTNYINPETKESIWCIRGEQPEGWTELKHLKKVEELIKTISKEDLFNYYIIENHRFDETSKHYNITPEGCLHDLLKYYNIKKDHKLQRKNDVQTRTHESYVSGGAKSAETQKTNWNNKSCDEKEEWSNKMKESHSTESFKSAISQINKDYYNNLSEEDKLLRNETISKASKEMWKDPEHILKVRDGKRKARKSRKCRSKAEQHVYDELIKIYDDLVYDDIVDKDRYPYFIDFYIPSKDLFIELNAHPSHGNKPWTGDISECYNLTGNWLDTYVRRDPEKLRIANENNLNYIMVYPGNSLENNYSINNNKYKDIVEVVYRSAQE